MTSRHILLTCAALALSGCAGMKTDFDCQATASDSCMTMQQADDKARDLDAGADTSRATQRGTSAKPSGRSGSGRLPSLIDMSRSLTPIRVAPASAPVPVMPSRTLSYPAGQAATSYPAPTGVESGSLLSFERTTPAQVVGHDAALSAAALPASCQDCTPRQPAPQREIESVVRLWIAPYVDSVDAVHMPGEVYFVKKPSTWRARYEP